MATITHTSPYTNTTDTYEIVESIPVGYIIWNIGRNAPKGYLPLCRPARRQRFDGGRDIDPGTLKAIEVDGAEIVLAAIGHGQDTLPEMERYVKRYCNSKTDWVQHNIALYRKAIPIMRQIKGIEHLLKW